MWRSLVAHLTGGQGVAGSNPVIPTNFRKEQRVSRGRLARFVLGRESMPSVRRRRGLRIAVLLSLPVSAAGLSSQAPDTSTRAVVAAVAQYVADYQRDLTSILADESYAQDVISRMPGDPTGARSRRMASEVFFMFMPGTRDWMAIRDVIAVDGVPVEDRPDIRQALEVLSSTEVAAALKRQNSRFNIGRILRNFSEPTLSLLVFDANHRRRFSFERTRVRNDGNAVLVTLAFTERETPTLITDPRRGRIFSTGEVVVEAGTGRVRWAVLRAKSGEIKVELTTDYARDERLDMWVPAVFRETYERGRPPRRLEADTEYEHLVCEARYRNFRRFQTSARIK
jgi:hypothetical protein